MHRLFTLPTISAIGVTTLASVMPTVSKILYYTFIPISTQEVIYIGVNFLEGIVPHSIKQPLNIATLGLSVMALYLDGSVILALLTANTAYKIIRDVLTN